MRIDIMTLFPETLERVLGESIIGRAQQRELVNIRCHQIRDYTTNKQMQVDDYPYGGGMGMIMQADPLYNCWKDICDEAGGHVHTILMSPAGKPYTQTEAKRLSRLDRFVLVCGHYEGVDERFIEECVDEELSLGDFVLTGGEIAALAIADSVCRLCPGVLADESCFEEESHWSGVLEYPQYSRPELWRGRRVPLPLLNGNHDRIKLWRRRESLRRTLLRRPDLLERAPLDKTDQKLLAEIRAELEAPDYEARRATPEDVDAIMEIVADAQAFLKSRGVDQWQNGYPLPEHFLIDIERGDCWLFLQEGRPVGVITLSLRPESSYATITEGKWLTRGNDYGVMHRSAVRAECRGTTLAQTMIEFCEGQTVAAGKASLRMDTHRENRAMRGLMKKCGFTYCGVIHLQGSSEDGKPRVTYEKLLRRK